MDEVQNQLGKKLRSLRRAAGHSLRAVEEACGVSNAYLSQVETGKVRKPAPSILGQLASLYDASFEELMRLAGHIADVDKKKGRSKTESLPLSATKGLTDEEKAKVLEYIGFLRMQRGNEDAEG